MRLEAEPPFWSGETELDRVTSVAFELRTIHRLDREMLEREVLELDRIQSVLGNHDLQLVAPSKLERRACLGTYADPVEASRRVNGPVRFHGDLEAALVESLDQRRIELKQRFATGTDDETPRGELVRPVRGDCLGDNGGVAEFASARSI